MYSVGIIEEAPWLGELQHMHLVRVFCHGLQLETCSLDAIAEAGMIYDLSCYATPAMFD